MPDNKERNHQSDRQSDHRSNYHSQLQPKSITTEEVEAVTQGFLDNWEDDVSEFMDHMQVGVEQIMDELQQELEDEHHGRDRRHQQP